MGVSLRLHDRRVSKQVPQFRQRNAFTDQPACKRVAQVVNSEVLNPRFVACLPKGVIDLDNRLAVFLDEYFCTTRRVGVAVVLA